MNLMARKKAFATHTHERLTLSRIDNNKIDSIMKSHEIIVKNLLAQKRTYKDLSNGEKNSGMYFFAVAFIAEQFESSPKETLRLYEKSYRLNFPLAHHAVLDTLGVHHELGDYLVWFNKLPGREKITSRGLRTFLGYMESRGCYKFTDFSFHPTVMELFLNSKYFEIVNNECINQQEIIDNINLIDYATRYMALRGIYNGNLQPQVRLMQNLVGFIVSQTNNRKIKNNDWLPVKIPLILNVLSVVRKYMLDFSLHYKDIDNSIDFVNKFYDDKSDYHYRFIISSLTRGRLATMLLDYIFNKKIDEKAFLEYAALSREWNEGFTGERYKRKSYEDFYIGVFYYYQKDYLKSEKYMKIAWNNNIDDALIYLCAIELKNTGNSMIKEVCIKRKFRKKSKNFEIKKIISKLNKDTDLGVLANKLNIIRSTVRGGSVIYRGERSSYSNKNKQINSKIFRYITSAINMKAISNLPSDEEMYDYIKKIEIGLYNKNSYTAESFAEIKHLELSPHNKKFASANFKKIKIFGGVNLIDYTKNPIVSMFFAAEEGDDKNGDGYIYSVKVPDDTVISETLDNETKDNHYIINPNQNHPNPEVFKNINNQESVFIRTKTGVMKLKNYVHDICPITSEEKYFVRLFFSSMLGVEGRLYYNSPDSAKLPCKTSNQIKRIKRAYEDVIEMINRSNKNERPRTAENDER